MKNKLLENQLKKILLLLEDAVLTDSDSTLLEKLAKNHLANVKKLNDLQAQIDALVSQQSSIEEKNEVIKDEILTMIGETKSQSFRFGKLIVDFKITRETAVSKSSPQYKAILEALVSQGKVEEKIVNAMIINPLYNKGNKTFTNVNKELTIARESVQLKENNFLNIINTVWRKARGIFQNFFSVFKGKNDQIEQAIAQLQ